MFLFLKLNLTRRKLIISENKWKQNGQIIYLLSDIFGFAMEVKIS